MPEYLILKFEGDDPLPKAVSIVTHDGEPKDALPEGFKGDGRYAAVDWGERVECDLAPGPVAVSALEDKEVREKAAEEAVAEEQPAEVRE